MGKHAFEKTKKILNIFTIIFCVLILATIPIALCYAKAPTEVTMPVPTLAPIPINATTNSQDSQWLATYLSNKDSQKAINDSDLYSVSPDLQSAKDEYRLQMIQAKSAQFIFIMESKLIKKEILKPEILR